MKRYLFLLVIMLVGCVHQSTGVNSVEAITKSWIGAPVEVAINQWGFPSTERAVLGHKLVTWHREDHYNDGRQEVYIFCDRTFEIDQQGKILKAEWRGNCDTAYSRWARKTP